MSFSRIIRWSGVILGGLLALVIIGVLVLHTPPVKRYALKQVQNLLRNQGVQFDATGLDYNLLKLSLSLRDVVVRSTAAPDLPALASIKRVSADLALWQLLRGFYRVEDVQLSGVNIHLVIDEQGRDNIPKPPEKESTGEPLEYLIDHAQIDEGALRVEDRRQQIDATLPLWQVTVDGNPLTRIHQVRFNTQSAGQVSLEQRTLAIDDIHIDALLGQDAVDLNELRVRTEASTLAVSGRLADFSDPSFDTRLEANLDLASLAKFAGVNQRIEGTLNAQIGAKGPLGKLEVQADVKGDDLTVHQFDRLDLDLTSTYSAEAQRVYVKSLSVASPSGTIQGGGNIALNADAGRSSLNVAVHNLNLERLSRSFDLPVVIASRANAQLEASWPGLEYEQAAAGVKLQIARLRLQPAENVLPVAASLTANVAGRTAQVRIANLEALAAQGSGRVTVDARERLDGGVQIEVPSVRDLLGGLSGFLGRTEPLAGGAIDGPATLEARFGGTIGNPQVVARLSSPGLEAGQLKEVVLDVNAAYAKDRLVLETAAIRWREQSITASGTVGLKGSTQELDLEARVADASIADVLSGLGSDIPAAGTVNATVTAGGTTKNPLANVEITASGLQAYGESFGDLIAQASLENNLLTVSRVQLDKPDSGSFTANGTYNLESQAFTLQAEAPDFRIRQMTLPDGVPVQAEIDLSAQGSGTVNDPDVTAKLDVSGLRVNNEEISDLNAAVKVANRTANLQFRAPRYQLVVDASAGIESPNPVRFEVRMEGFDLATLPVKLEQPLEGTVTATVTGNGEARNWKQGQAKAEIAQLD
ncbi:MAG: AsmA family protein, partial [Bryobacteraceae bacterium]|nr:AsmA family protein [Bryobacteraceae bacterium]